MAAEHRFERIVSNTALITGASLVQKALSFLFFWFLSSRYLPGELGSYLWVLSMTGLFVTGIDLGLTPILTREAAKTSTADGKTLAESVLWIKLPLALASVAALWVTVLFVRRDPATLALLSVATGVMLLDGFTMALYAALRARQVIRFEAIVLVTFQMLVLVLGVLATIATRSLLLVLVALLIGSASNFLVMQFAARRVYGSLLWPRRHRETIRTITKLIPAFAGNAVVTKIYSVGDVILLGILAGNAAVGLFSIPAKVATALQTLVPAAFATSVYPSMANFATGNRDKLRLLFDRSMLYVFMLGLPIAVGLVLLAEPIMQTIWPAYTEATYAFAVMMLGIPFIFLTYSTGSLLNAVDRERRNTMHRTITTAANLILNVVLIPRFGVFGAAAAYSASNVLLFALDAAAAWRILSPDTGFYIRRWGGTMVSAAAMAAIIVLLRNRIQFWLLIPAAGAAYLGALVATRALRSGEFRALRNLLPYAAVPPPDA